MQHLEEVVLEKKLDPKSKSIDDGLWRKLLKVHFKRILVSLVGFVLSRISFYQLNPIAIAYYSVVYLDKSSRMWIFLSTVIGFATILPILDFVKYFLIIMLMITFNTYLEVRGKKVTLIVSTCVSAVSTFVINYAFVFLQGNLGYFTTLAILESIIVITFGLIYFKSVSYMLSNERKMPLTNEQIISFGILVTTIIIGLMNIEILNYSVTEIAIFSSILYFAYSFGVGIGAVVGLLIGTVLVTIGLMSPLMVGALGIIGLLSGLFREVGRIGSAIGLTLGTILLGYYYTPELLGYDITRALIISIAIFLFMPKQWITRIGAEKEKVIISNEYYKNRFQSLIKERLNIFSESFQKLAETFTSISDKRSGLTQQEVNQIFDEVAEKVCKNCSMCSLCWQKEFYDTYKAAFSILGAAEKKGRIQKNDIPDDFYNKCIKLDEFIITTNRLFELFKINLSWHNRIIESRELVSEQLIGVSNIIDNFAEELYANINSEKRLEKDLEIELKKYPVIIKSIIVVEKQNKKEVYITLRSSNQAIGSKEFLPVVSKVMKKKMRLDESSKYTVDKEYVTLKFNEEKLFRTIQGLARATKEGEKVSGDNFSFLELQNGQTILSLSDGMGTGLKACRESEAVIELLEQFMEAGFDKKTAIKMINSVLVLKSNEHSFSTLDMSVVDLHTGICEFIKIGAGPTFIKRKDSVEIIKSTSLPVGVLNTVDFDTTTKKLYEGDFLIMVTDGIVDADSEMIEKEYWIEEILQEINSKNPQEIAEYILERAKNKYGNKVQDDMTVLVSRIWKK
ncbi:stage II sporulation protein E [Natranaerovirga pectinivora]|uniref:Stage II sporulation protein E n=1 Tax=Natranaerovirga pectinivora TaxID=682400 RepID=A0A4R3MK34_9FIRM|nr:stage II sporulation protein E [Natranaerovirga pectinivora]TCT13048.1 stage II sporulation protein E [Natranaerovirga pectinivora]